MESNMNKIIKAIRQIEELRLPELKEDEILIPEEDKKQIEMRRKLKGDYELPKPKIKNEMSAFERAIAETAGKMQTYIGIDPDIQKSGWATWETGSKTLTVDAITFPQIVAILQDIARYDGGTTKVVLEAGWLNKPSNFHSYINTAVGMRIAAKVGQNHAVGLLIEQLLQDYNIPYELYRPRAGKWSAEYFKTITGLTQRTNSEMRDAAKLVFGR